MTPIQEENIDTDLLEISTAIAAYVNARANNLLVLVWNTLCQPTAHQWMYTLTQGMGCTLDHVKADIEMVN